jgi:hypothetical protein
VFTSGWAIGVFVGVFRNEPMKENRTNARVLHTALLPMAT